VTERHRGWADGIRRGPARTPNEVVGKPAQAAQYLDENLRTAFLAAIEKHPVIHMPRVRPRSMAVYERMHALPSEIVSWHADNYAEAIRREYAWVPQDRYAEGRTRVLNGFLERPEIFTHREFRQRLDEQARVNLRWEIRELAKATATTSEPNQPDTA